MPSLQTLFVLAVVTGAAGYLVRRVVQVMRGAAVGCGSCGNHKGCKTRTNALPQDTVQQNDAVQQNGATLPLVTLDDQR